MQISLMIMESQRYGTFAVREREELSLYLYNIA